jgi:hypothetical protein
MYHQDKRLSASKLKNYLQHDARIAHHLETHPTESTEAMRLGTALHAMLEGQPLTVSPYAEYRTNEAKAWRDSHPEALKESEAEQVRAWHNAILTELERVDLLDVYRMSDKEVEFFSNTHKAKVDAFDQHSGIILDYKTSACTSFRDLERDMQRYCWPLQAAHYLDMSKASRFIFVVVCKSAPYPVWIVECSPDAITYGRSLCQKAEAIRAEYLAGNQPGIVMMDAPAWAV